MIIIYLSKKYKNINDLYLNELRIEYHKRIRIKIGIKNIMT